MLRNKSILKGKKLMKKKILAAVLASALLLSVAGCDQNTGNTDNTGTGTNTNAPTTSGNSTQGSDPAQSTPAGNYGTGELKPSDSEGKKIRIACWNYEFKSFVDAFYKLPDGYEIEWVQTPNDEGAYQKKLDEQLDANESASADEKIDMFLAEADYIQKYSFSDNTIDLSTIGVDKADTMYDYVVNAGSDQSGKLKGVSWQATPSCVIIRKSIAKDVLGTDNPDELQSKLDTWEKFADAAKAAKEKGYYITPSALETYRTFANNATTSYLTDDKFAPTEAFNTWLKQAEDFTKNGYVLNTLPELWDDGKTDHMYKDGKAMCFFGPSWYFNFSMGKAMDEDKGSKGDWVIIQGPQAHFWGGTWMMAAKGTDNPEIVADIMNAFTKNEDILEKLVKGKGIIDPDTQKEKDNPQFVNNKNVIKKFAEDSSYGNNVILDGQNDIAVMSKIADGIKWDGALHTRYDQTFNETLPQCMNEYLKSLAGVEGVPGVTLDKAWSNFYDKLEAVNPDITH